MIHRCCCCRVSQWWSHLTFNTIFAVLLSSWEAVRVYDMQISICDNAIRMMDTFIDRIVNLLQLLLLRKVWQSIPFLCWEIVNNLLSDSIQFAVHKCWWVMIISDNCLCICGCSWHLFNKPPICCWCCVICYGAASCERHFQLSTSFCVCVCVHSSFRY